MDSLHYHFLSQKILHGQTIFDIGANKGQTALVLKSCVGEKGKVVSFEPVPNEYDSLCTNIEINQINNIIPVKVALSDSAGEAIFEYNTAKPTMGKLSSVEPSYVVANTTSFQVQTDTIDKLVETGQYIPDVIKIDVEGAGAAVLRGARKTLKILSPSVFIELHGSEKQQGVQEELFARGYTIKTL